jgi:hypothetical protein
MAARNQADQDAIDDVRLANNYFPDFIAHARKVGRSAINGRCAGIQCFCHFTSLF